MTINEVIDRTQRFTVQENYKPGDMVKVLSLVESMAGHVGRLEKEFNILKARLDKVEDVSFHAANIASLPGQRHQTGLTAMNLSALTGKAKRVAEYMRPSSIEHLREMVQAGEVRKWKGGSARVNNELRIFCGLEPVVLPENELGKLRRENARLRESCAAWKKFAHEAYTHRGPCGECLSTDDLVSAFEALEKVEST